MVRLLDADPADVAVFGSGGAIDVAGEAKLDLVDFPGIWDDIGDLDVSFDVFVFGDEQEFALCFVLLILGLILGTIF